jgi:hypothetical protein
MYAMRQRETHADKPKKIEASDGPVVTFNWQQG